PLARRHPAPSPSPSTTLFRSQRQHQLAEPQTEEGHQHVTGIYPTALMGFRLLVQPAFPHHVLAHHRHTDQPAQHQPQLHTVSQRDRKSTRLNSSHVKTSYAVF